MCQYVFDASRIDTSPGNPLSPFSPPHGWDGEKERYRDWLLREFRVNPNFRQRLGIAVRASSMNKELHVFGCFRTELLEIIETFGKKGR
ncbi:hypothetical protein [Methylosarcina fibrata]|jgi:hypothetical protein|uniref:hypothetical protein n=1 Tax=Methylosarcina fibrata TaxID=105972 RepID=UPI0012FA87A6|nr:hypothetical protein [Methylosarcina fibrata]